MLGNPLWLATRHILSAAEGYFENIKVLQLASAFCSAIAVLISGRRSPLQFTLHVTRTSTLVAKVDGGPRSRR